MMNVQYSGSALNSGWNGQLRSCGIYETGVRNALIALGLIEGKAESPTFRQQKFSQNLKRACPTS